MPRYRLTLEYDGSAFYGWQIQLHDKTIQGVLTDAIARINGEPAMVQGAGRTDAGVHALGQVAHVDLQRDWDPFVLRNAINAGVRPHKICVVLAELVPDSFNARFSGTRRHYLYRILNRRAPPTLDLGQVWFVPVELDAGAMHEAAQILVGHHDFSTFRDSQCQAQSPMRTLDRLDVSRFGEFIEIRTESRSFLHSQVRSMVGSLKLVGEGKWTAKDLKSVLDAKDRTACGVVAPPEGLYLVRVDY
jgi:tRNA pseudouridine38-40 synthase